MTFSKLVRRTHMYLALFLSPWILGYAVSTIAMSHRWLGGPPTYTLEREQPYESSFPADMPRQDIARRILADLKLEGTYGVQGPAPDGRLTINRQDLLTPRRIVFAPADKKVIIERVDFHMGAFLNRLHRRRGYQPPYAPDRLVAVVVDAVVVAMVFWGLSGLWMWWEMRATRWWGVVSMGAGLSIFVVLMVAL